MRKRLGPRNRPGGRALAPLPVSLVAEGTAGEVRRHGEKATGVAQGGGAMGKCVPDCPCGTRGASAGEPEADDDERGFRQRPWNMGGISVRRGTRNDGCRVGRSMGDACFGLLWVARTGNRQKRCPILGAGRDRVAPLWVRRFGLRAGALGHGQRIPAFSLSGLVNGAIARELGRVAVAKWAVVGRRAPVAIRRFPVRRRGTGGAEWRPWWCG